jgi:uncharacterized protein (DUF2235 family)
MKNIVVCCDGTANEFARDRTNVVKLFATLVKDPLKQMTYYHPGVGTLAPPGFVTRVGATTAQLAGLAFGYGLDQDVRDIYIYIANNFEQGDCLFLFGFSRGAYTIRAVAALLHMYGLIPKCNEPLVPYAVRLMWKIHSLQMRHTKSDAAADRIKEYFSLAAQFKDTFSRACHPHFVGVWDTVSSVGWFANPLSLPFTANNPDIAIGRHAIAIDERRAFFRTNLWRPAQAPAAVGPRDLKQVWFPGVHCDVGGGYPESESGLAKIALKWMAEEAAAAGLIIDATKLSRALGGEGEGFVSPDPNGMIHKSLTWQWRIAEYMPKPHWDGTIAEWRANLGRARTWPSCPIIHDAAWLRDGNYADCLPHDAIRLSTLVARNPVGP